MPLFKDHEEVSFLNRLVKMEELAPSYADVAKKGMIVPKSLPVPSNGIAASMPRQSAFTSAERRGK